MHLNFFWTGRVAAGDEKKLKAVYRLGALKWRIAAYSTKSKSKEIVLESLLKMLNFLPRYILNHQRCPRKTDYRVVFEAKFTFQTKNASH